MTHDEAFFQAVLEAPDDDAVRLIWADWLDDHDAPERAAFIRDQIALARLADNDPARNAVAARARAALAAHEGAWVAADLRGLVEGGTFRRGLVEGVTLKAADFLQHAEQLFRLAPIRRVRLRQPQGHLRGVAVCPDLARLTALDLRGNGLDDDALRPLFASPHLARLAALDLSNNHLGAASARRLVECGSFPGLVDLDLGLNMLDGDAAAALACQAATSWRRLDLRSNRVGDAGAAALAASRHLAGLLCLSLAYNGLTHVGAAALGASHRLAALRSLDLNWNALRPVGVIDLAAGGMPALAALDLADTLAGDAGLVALLRGGRFADLNLKNNGVTDAGVRALLRAPPPAALRRLVLAGNPISDRLRGQAERSAWGMFLCFGDPA
jgi:uncharacterized protein (TIGR02996 family)